MHMLDVLAIAGSLVMLAGLFFLIARPGRRLVGLMMLAVGLVPILMIAPYR